MMPTLQQLQLIAGSSSAKTNANGNSVIEGLKSGGQRTGLLMPHRLAHYIPQLMHESMGLVHDKEIWGPTPAQKRYDTRTDLGNTPEADGDGKLYAGRTALQLTGKSNYEQFTGWCRRHIDPNCPDFVANPELVNTDPWEGVVPIWYWSTRKLNDYADENNIEMVTQRINGGLNGFDDRIRYYVRTALVLLGFAPEDVKDFQRIAQNKGLLPADTPDKTQIDGKAGPLTRTAMHKMLVALSAETAHMPSIKSAPVVEEVEVAVVPKGADKRVGARLWSALPLLGTPVAAFGGLDNTGKIIVTAIALGGVIALLFFGEMIAARAKSVIKSFGE